MDAIGTFDPFMAFSLPVIFHRTVIHYAFSIISVLTCWLIKTFGHGYGHTYISILVDITFYARRYTMRTWTLWMWVQLYVFNAWVRDSCNRRGYIVIDIVTNPSSSYSLASIGDVGTRVRFLQIPNPSHSRRHKQVSDIDIDDNILNGQSSGDFCSATTALWVLRLLFLHPRV